MCTCAHTHAHTHTYVYVYITPMALLPVKNPTKYSEHLIFIDIKTKHFESIYFEGRVRGKRNDNIEVEMVQCLHCKIRKETQGQSPVKE